MAPAAGGATAPGTAATDGNDAAAQVAYQLSDVIAIYPITPASAMGEAADAWAAAGRPNLWGSVPKVVEMQSEGGAAGAVHGALTSGALATTFTASQGLLLMLPNMFKIAGELAPAVIHVAARTVATHALSIFGDHSDVMAARTTGFAMLASSSVQEAQDLAAIAHAATLRARVPFLHFFDGFRTSHEINQIDRLPTTALRALVDEELVLAHRRRGMNPDHPVLRGSAQNPDVFFQAREAANPFYAAVPTVVGETMAAFGELTGRRYHLFDYVGHPEADRVIIAMGSGCGAAEETVDELNARGERVGVLKVRLFRPFAATALAAALPATVTSVAVLDRTKEPGAPGEPLYTDVVTALAERSPADAGGAALPGSGPRVIGGRYGLSSKEFTPAMAHAVFEELRARHAKNHFTVGIIDDVTGTSLAVDPSFRIAHGGVLGAVFFGLGSDGTVGASKNSVRIVSEHTNLYAQGYFVLDSKKSGSVTVSHLRFSPEPIRSTYLLQEADFVACHQFAFLTRMDVLSIAKPGATFLLNSPFGPGEVWLHLPAEVQEEILTKQLRFSVVDGASVAAAAGLGVRINTVLQTCFFALSGLLDPGDAIAAIKASIAATYAKRGETVLARNYAAVDGALAGLSEVSLAGRVAGGRRRSPIVPAGAPDFVQRVTAAIMAGKGDQLPVSALPVDGTFPTGTARWEKRAMAAEIPVWDPSICIDCGKCALVCPHAAIRMKVYEPTALAGAPGGFRSKPFHSKEIPGKLLTIQVAPDDCTGCGICVDVCPAHAKEQVRHKSINMEPSARHADTERASFDFFLGLPDPSRAGVDGHTVKGSQTLPPLFEFSGACAGCGETPYLKLISQMFGDRLVIANATGCSSIYGGNLPTTPWSVGPDGRGPAWSNSLFEDNAEYGLGIRLALDQRAARARRLVQALAPAIGTALAAAILAEEGSDDRAIAAQRRRVEELGNALRPVPGDLARELETLAGDLVARSVWIVGGDGWAYDIGFGGLDQVLASGANVNVLVLDTEVYSNTGGQASKSTPRAAMAKFASGGKTSPKKDLGLLAMAYGSIYVAQVALGADNPQALRALVEAESYDGPSLVLAYSHCIAHGIDMREGMSHQKEAVDAGYWPLYRYDPRLAAPGRHPLTLDSHKPKRTLKEFVAKEGRFAMLARSRPEQADRLLGLLQDDIDNRWRFYEQMAGVERTAPGVATPEVATPRRAGAAGAPGAGGPLGGGGDG
ncbi:MAG TPA: pyruvate:ferredoxin (flavodoxin) oxidoreductase [Actinomycetota bacterium]|nr:pyruvate:ferredoxin (flavodoxin) oxidoreductase [Actinomycetota bacterium]